MIPLMQSESGLIWWAYDLYIIQTHLSLDWEGTDATDMIFKSIFVNENIRIWI